MTEQTSKAVLTVPDIVCGGCANSIKNALGKMEGINQIEVDVQKKSVAVEYDKKVSREEIETVLDDIGFPVEN